MIETVTDITAGWPRESRAAARAVVETYGEPHEITTSLLTWYEVGPWKRVVVSRTCYEHNFPAPHLDVVECVVDYRVPSSKCSAVVAFDGSVTVDRTAGEVSARCHDERANLLALNLVHDIVMGDRDAQQARDYYAQEFSAFRRELPAPYMERLYFEPARSSAGDPDVAVLAEEDFECAAHEGGFADRDEYASPMEVRQIKRRR